MHVTHHNRRGRYRQSASKHLSGGQSALAVLGLLAVGGIIYVAAWKSSPSGVQGGI